MWFDRQAEEAMNWYVEIFNASPKQQGSSRIISIERYPEGPLIGPMQGLENKVLSGTFELAGQRFMALDGGPFFQPNGAVSFYIDCDSQEEVDHYWDRLTQDGDPAAQQCGWLKDKFGFSWQVIPTALPQMMSHPNKAISNQVMQAMLQMKKIDVAVLEKAYNDALNTSAA